MLEVFVILACVGTIGSGPGVQCRGKPEVCLDDSMFPDRGSCKSLICLCINQIRLMVQNPNQTDDVRSIKRKGEEDDESCMY